jgi:hypothetical protein
MFAEKFCKKLAFLTKNKVKLCKNLIIPLVFEKNAIFLAENSRKSPKIVIITSTPGRDGHAPVEDFRLVVDLPLVEPDEAIAAWAHFGSLQACILMRQAHFSRGLHLFLWHTKG